MDHMSRSGSEIEHQGADLREQLHAIVNSEMDLFADVDKIAEVSQLQTEVNQFMANLQQRFDGYILEIERENASAAEAAEDEAVEAALAATAPTETEHLELNKDDVMNLEKEFGTYGITQANGIGEGKRTPRETVIQSLIGATIAVALMWVFWPTADHDVANDAVDLAKVESVKPVVTEKVAPVVTDKTAAVKAEEMAALKAVEDASIVVTTTEVMPQESKPELAVTEATPPKAVADTKISTADPVAKPIEKTKVEKQVAAKEPETVVNSIINTVMTSVEPMFAGEKIKVTAHFGNVRSAPDNSGKVVSRLKKGEEVYKLDEKDGWFQVRLDDEKTAWVHKSLFAPRLKVGVDVGNIRTQPTGKGKIVTRLKKGDYVTKTGEQKGWYQVKLDSGKTAWAHRSIF
ncbi:SH3 domain-containing protein [Mariprofundus sp. NF]|nr:SH3 domain-containing protein [Mariprofundus sp. NF]